jgi:hypothetical protein
MALRNPYSAYARHGDAPDERQALLDALDEPPPMPAHPRTPVRTPEQTREMLSGPGGQTQAVDTPDVGSNAFSGDRWQDERQGDAYTPPTTQSTQPSHRYNPQRGFQLMDEYDDPYTRRMEGSPGVGSSAAKGASLGGSIVPGYGHAIGAAAGAIAALFTKNAKTAVTDFAIDDAKQIISQAHEDAFGRQIDPAYLNQILRGQGWQDGDRWMGQDSLAYVLDAFASQAPGDRAATAAANAAAAQQGAQAATPAGATAGAPPYAMEGFDLQRAQDPSFSVKDAFAAAVRQAGEPPPGEDKVALGEWFKKYAQPFIEAQGHKVNWVEGDKVNITGPQGTGTTDWYRGAGAKGGALAWQPEDGGGGGGPMGDAPTDIAGAYAFLKSYAHPGMSRAEMESAVAKAFGNVPGFEKAYAGDVVINGKKLDLITDFEGANPQWSDNLNFVPLHGGGSPAGGGGVVGAGVMSGLNLAPGAQLAAPLGRSDVLAQIQEELNRLLRGEPPRDELLEALG